MWKIFVDGLTRICLKAQGVTFPAFAILISHLYFC